MSDEQTHLAAVERYIDDSHERIAGFKLHIAELESRGENTALLVGSLGRAEKALASMVAYRDQLVAEMAGRPPDVGSEDD